MTEQTEYTWKLVGITLKKLVQLGFKMFQQLTAAFTGSVVAYRVYTS